MYSNLEQSIIFYYANASIILSWNDFIYWSGDHANVITPRTNKYFLLEKVEFAIDLRFIHVYYFLGKEEFGHQFGGNASIIPPRTKSFVTDLVVTLWY